ncbi:SDR family NAD(P)-dependent oxidoreductase [Sphingomonas cavernae]|uniref:SDR family oxidoreductase n=1 Tax=Sphingomonas cavernae TaxID=2320861 RepID=A0A418W7H4_9SPHN|nr:SDR family oxidoreductase [Sphingomonas cavernae]RJF85824.1 SDR family oxidoreductase [Sphingomonas cavernae]
MTRAVALITGASAGLGVRFAEGLAAEKRDLLLVARRADRLEALAARLTAEHGVTVDVIAIDLSAPDAPRTLIDKAHARGLSIVTLVNNAGFGARGAFDGLDLARQIEMIDLNCRALVALCHLVLPGMIARGKGEILNVASTAAFQPGPWMAVYYATKAFVLSFSEALHEEMKDKGVHVSALCPGPTRTEFADVANMKDSELFKRFATDPDRVVRDGLTALRANRAVKVSGVMNAAMAGSIRFTPRGLARRIAASLQRARSD